MYDEDRKRTHRAFMVSTTDFLIFLNIEENEQDQPKKTLARFFKADHDRQNFVNI